MADSSPRRTLGDYFTLQRGTTYKSRLLGTPGPVLLGLATIQRNGGFRRDSLQTYGGDSPGKLLVRPGELYLSLKDVTQSADLLGAVARLPHDHAPGRLTQDTVKLEPKSPDAPLDYLYWLLRTPQYRGYCRSHATGTTNLGLAREDFLAFPAPAPTRGQLRIVDTLTALDAKIELNRRINETLEAMARALFKSWFVDFDPVRAKAEGRDPGLPKPLADLFPARLVDSELDEIPEGWEVRPLRDLTGYLSRGIGPAYLEAGGLCVLNQKCIRDWRIDFSKARRHDPEKKSGDGRLLKRLDVLVNSTGVGTLGRAAQLWHLPEPTIVDSHVTVLRAASGVDPWFLGIGLTGREDEIEALGEGSTGQTELSRARLGDLPCIVPPQELQARFGVTAEYLLGRVSSAERESESLAKLREALLPKLISGELRVKDAGKPVARAV
ncbi:MAG: restriction endonuclease subunit S [Burkholderiaceae bacterium]